MNTLIFSGHNKLNKDFFRLQKDLFLATVYVSPENSSGNVPDLESVYATLLDNVQYYRKSGLKIIFVMNFSVKRSRMGDNFIQGDFNAYTNICSDYIELDDT